MARQVWTPKRAAAKSRRKVEAARRLLQEIAYEWGEVDNYVVLAVENIERNLDDLLVQIAEAVSVAEEEEDNV